MKTAKIFLVLLVVGILIGSSIITAKAAATTDLPTAKIKAGTLTVRNMTGGTLYVSLSGPRSYFFSAGGGKTVFKGIQPGKYVITVTASACGGSLTFKRNIKGNASLPTFVCRH